MRLTAHKSNSTQRNACDSSLFSLSIYVLLVTTILKQSNQIMNRYDTWTCFSSYAMNSVTTVVQPRIFAECYNTPFSLCFFRKQSPKLRKQTQNQSEFFFYSTNWYRIQQHEHINSQMCWKQKFIWTLIALVSVDLGLCGGGWDTWSIRTGVTVWVIRLSDLLTHFDLFDVEPRCDKFQVSFWR